jgi:hypothetical protein
MRRGNGNGGESGSGSGTDGLSRTSNARRKGKEGGEGRKVDPLLAHVYVKIKQWTTPPA